MVTKEQALISRGRKTSYRIKKRNKNNLLRIKLHVTLRYLYVQLIDDTTGKTLCSASSLESSMKKKLGSGYTLKSKKSAEVLADFFATKLVDKYKARGFVFDRGPKPYAGKVKSFVENLQKKGIKI